MAASGELTVQALGRNGLVLAGLLCLAVGLGNTLTGRSKLVQYENLVRSSTPDVHPPAALFPQASEAHERRAVALAKLGFYQLILLAGQFLVAFGFLFIAAGIVQLRLRVQRAGPSAGALTPADGGPGVSEARSAAPPREHRTAPRL